MNRRSFFSKLTAAVAGFTILPPATTYSRIWRATREDDPWELEWHDLDLDGNSDLIVVDPTCTCTLTRAAIVAMTPEMFLQQSIREERLQCR